MPPAAWRGSLPTHLVLLKNNGICISIKRPGAECDCNSGKYAAIFKNLKERYCIKTKDEAHFQPGAVPSHLLFTPREE